MTLIADGLSFGMRKHPGDANLYEFGVTHNGAFLPLMVTKSGRIEKLLARATHEQQQQQQPSSQPSNG